MKTHVSEYLLTDEVSSFSFFLKLCFTKVKICDKTQLISVLLDILAPLETAKCVTLYYGLIISFSKPQNKAFMVICLTEECREIADNCG